MRLSGRRASPEIGGRSSSVFPADPKHIASVILKHRPSIVVALGKIAADGVLSALATNQIQQQDQPFSFEIITGPHPTSRQDPMSRLREIGSILKKAVNSDATT